VGDLTPARVGLTFDDRGLGIGAVTHRIGSLGKATVPFRVYLCIRRRDIMHIVKIRRVGNSNVISLPKELEQSGFTPGTSVALEETPTGEVLIVPASRLQRDFGVIMRRIVPENRGALDMLAAYDRGESSQAAKDAIKS